VLGVSGGIAAYKSVEVLRGLREAGHEVTVVPTSAALNFVGEATWAALSGQPVATSVWADVDHRPTVRGVAMNPIDHPHGGGEGRTGEGRVPVNPWGQPTKGYRTRRNKRTSSMIVQRRYKK